MRHEAGGRGEAMDIVRDPAVSDRGNQGKCLVDGIYLISDKGGDERLRSEREDQNLDAVRCRSKI